MFELAAAAAAKAHMTLLRPTHPTPFNRNGLDLVTWSLLGRTALTKNIVQKICDLRNIKLPDEFRDITLPAAYVLQHTESLLAVMFSGTVAILTNALHVCVTGSSRQILGRSSLLFEFMSQSF